MLNSQIRLSSKVISSEIAKGEEQSSKMILGIQRLQETELIKKKMLLIIGITSLIGAFSLIVPYIYTIVPVYETL